jgi:hypothetical protein
MAPDRDVGAVPGGVLDGTDGADQPGQAIHDGIMLTGRAVGGCLLSTSR